MQCPVNMISYKRAPIVSLSLDIERRQSFIESVNKWTLFGSEPLFNFLSLFLNVVLLKWTYFYVYYGLQE